MWGEGQESWGGRIGGVWEKGQDSWGERMGEYGRKVRRKKGKVGLQLVFWCSTSDEAEGLVLERQKEQRRSVHYSL